MKIFFDPKTRPAQATFRLTLFALLLCFSGLSAQHQKYLGNVWRTTYNSAPAGFSQLFDQVTPENSGKWGVAEPVQGQFKWENQDSMYAWAKRNSALVKHHTFVWGQQQPTWMNAMTNSTAAKAAVENWIRTYMARYGDAVNFIDVVNEPLHAKPEYRNLIGGDGITGWDWLIWVYETARKYAPKAALHINDYSILSSDGATANYLKIIQVLKERKLIDGIGLQGHFYEAVDSTKLASNLNKLAATGLPIYFTEYDVNIADDQEQLKIYRQQFTLFWQHPSVKGITLWGYREGEVWRKNAFLLRADGTDRPALKWLRSFVKKTSSMQGKRGIKSKSLDSSPSSFFNVAGRKESDPSLVFPVEKGWAPKGPLFKR